MAGSPWRFLRSPWPWRGLAYVFSTLVVALAGWACALVLLLFPPALLLLGVPVGAVERARLRLMTPTRLPSPHASPMRVRQLVRDAATWRELGYTACLLTGLAALATVVAFVLFVDVVLLGLPLFLALLGPGEFLIHLGFWSVETVPEGFAAAALVGVPTTVVTLYGTTVLAGAQAAFATWLLGPSGTEINRRVDDLAESRGRLVNAFEAERRRIERDLHDGAQQHLLLLSMNLSLAERELSDPHERAGKLVGEAHQQARMALAAIREQIHGIHPQVLTDFGLEEAVRELAERCPIPVEVDLRLPGRLAPALESTAYFVVSEALTNVVRHAGATGVRVTGEATAERLTLAVVDDGRGGADPAAGTGIRGLADRVAVVEGTLEVDSPRGGPTVIRIELPCRSG